MSRRGRCRRPSERCSRAGCVEAPRGSRAAVLVATSGESGVCTLKGKDSSPEPRPDWGIHAQVTHRTGVAPRGSRTERPIHHPVAWCWLFPRHGRQRSPPPSLPRSPPPSLPLSSPTHTAPSRDPRLLPPVFVPCPLQNQVVRDREAKWQWWPRTQVLAQPPGCSGGYWGALGGSGVLWGVAGCFPSHRGAGGESQEPTRLEKAMLRPVSVRVRKALLPENSSWHIFQANQSLSRSCPQPGRS